MHGDSAILFVDVPHQPYLHNQFYWSILDMYKIHHSIIQLKSIHNNCKEMRYRVVIYRQNIKNGLLSIMKSTSLQFQALRLFASAVFLTIKVIICSHSETNEHKTYMNVTKKHACKLYWGFKFFYQGLNNVSKINNKKNIH